MYKRQDKDEYLNEVIQEVVKVLDVAIAEGEFDHKELTRLVRRATGKFVDLTTGRRPMLVPVVEIN